MAEEISYAWELLQDKVGHSACLDVIVRSLVILDFNVITTPDGNIVVGSASPWTPTMKLFFIFSLHNSVVFYYQTVGVYIKAATSCNNSLII